MKAFVELQTAFVFSVEGGLQLTKETARAWKRQRHGPKFSEQLVPGGRCEAFLVGRDGSEDVVEPL